MKKHMRREIEMKSDAIDLVRDYIWTKMLIMALHIESWKHKVLIMVHGTLDEEAYEVRGRSRRNAMPLI